MGKKKRSQVRRGRQAITHVEPHTKLDGATLVTCTLETGRTHQIRMHLSEDGHGLVGDPTYGRAPKDPALRKVGQELGRQALHATVLGFTHPVTGETHRFEAPMPPDMRAVLDTLRS